MARPKKVVNVDGAEKEEVNVNLEQEEIETKAKEVLEQAIAKGSPVKVEKYPNLLKVKVVQMHAGLDLIGSKTSINNKFADLYELDHGILAISKKEGRKVVIPYTNVRGYELV